MSEQQIPVEDGQPTAEKIVEFYGDQIPVAKMGEDLFVPLRPVIEALGLERSSQQRRVQRDPVLSKGSRTILMRGADGRVREQLCLSLDLLPGWLFGVTTSRIKPELQAKLNRYRAECFRVLWDAFKADVTAAAPRRTDLSSAEQTLELAAVVYHLAQQQVEFERGLTDLAHAQAADHDRLSKVADYMRGFIQQTNTRLTSLELRLDPAAAISDAQAAEIALGVKNVAYAMEQQGQSGGYGKVYSELYRRYRISSYKNLPRAKYDEVIGWLSKWYDEVMGKEQAS